MKDRVKQVLAQMLNDNIFNFESSYDTKISNAILSRASFSGHKISNKLTETDVKNIMEIDTTKLRQIYIRRCFHETLTFLC